MLVLVPSLSRPLGLLALALLGAAAPPSAALPSDHGDTPLLQMMGRQDVNLTDLHAFVRDDQLVLAVSTNPAIPPGTQSYLFPSDLTVAIHVDNHSEVSFENADANAMYGGQAVRPQQINDDITFVVTFDDAGAPDLKVKGLNAHEREDVRLFAGLRDDPFIRGPRIGRNAAAIVVSVPLKHVLRRDAALLLWATSHAPSIPIDIADHAGRSLRSMMSEFQVMNVMEPRFHERVLGMVTDVMIFDSSRPAAFPNGRALTDDVVDLVGDARILGSDAPFPTANDVPFLDTFPYLAPPQ